MNAQLTADRPTSVAQTPAAEQLTPLDSNLSTCPFLASLQSPPTVKIAWHQRFKQLFNPQEFQRLIWSQAGDASVIQVPKQLGFTNFVMPRSPDMVKEVFAGESTGVTRQADISSFGEQDSSVPPHLTPVCALPTHRASWCGTTYQLHIFLKVFWSSVAGQPAGLYHIVHLRKWV